MKYTKDMPGKQDQPHEVEGYDAKGMIPRTLSAYDARVSRELAERDNHSFVGLEDTGGIPDFLRRKPIDVSSFNKGVSISYKVLWGIIIIVLAALALTIYLYGRR